MNQNDLDFYWYWFVNIQGMGNRTRVQLLEEYGHPSRIYHLSGQQLKDYLGPKQQNAFDASKDYVFHEKQRYLLREKGIQFIHWESFDYPRRLRNLYDPPYGFYLHGKLPPQDIPALAMVGSRRATAYGRKTAALYAGRLAEEGIAVISGMAAGIDAASHRSALEHNGITLGILGGGIDTMYPKNNGKLYLDMYEDGGIMSEYNLGVPNHGGLFPMRNRLISGMSDGVLVVEAGLKSGSLITADQGMEQGKEIYALPGRISDPQSLGCNHLIVQGAFLTESPEDIILSFKERPEFQQYFFGQSQGKESLSDCLHPSHFFGTKIDQEEAEILAFLDVNDPVGFEILLMKTGKSIYELQHILMNLELKKCIVQPQQNMYLKNFL